VPAAGAALVADELVLAADAQLVAAGAPPGLAADGAQEQPENLRAVPDAASTRVRTAVADGANRARVAASDDQPTSATPRTTGDRGSRCPNRTLC
jgi:hypothetical protein